MDNFNITYHKHFDELDESCKFRIWQLLCSSNNEFIPPLSTRNGTNHTDFSDCVRCEEPTQYYESLKTQEWLIIRSPQHLIGFMSFYRISENTIYISTIIVDKSYRNNGVCGMLYNAIEQLDGCEILRTRTWSTNHAHISRLYKQGFHDAEILQNDRGPNIHTCYFEKSISRHPC